MKQTKYTVKATNQFKRDYKLLKKRKWNIDLLNEVITKLANGETLSQKFLDHPLSGNWIGHRECHIAPDFLLIYRIDEDVLVLTASRTGSHSDLLEK